MRYGTTEHDDNDNENDNDNDNDGETGQRKKQTGEFSGAFYKKSIRRDVPCRWDNRYFRHAMSGNFRERDTSLRCVGTSSEIGDTFGEQCTIQPIATSR